MPKDEELANVDEVEGADEQDSPRKVPSNLPALGAPPASVRSGSKKDLLSYYLSEVRKYPLLTREEEKEAAIKFVEEGDAQAAERLVTANLRLVIKIAFQYHRQWANVLDLIQEGNVGLVEALSRYDPYREIRFSSYAQYWIRAMILRFLLDNFRLVRLGSTRAGRKLFFQLQKERDRLMAEGINPTHKVLAERLGVDLAPFVAAGAEQTVQWATAMTIARSFSALEKNLLRFTDEEQPWLGQHRSLDLLDAEEHKHIALMDRVEAHLTRQRPDLAAAFERWSHLIDDAVARTRERSTRGSRTEAHYRFWVTLLFFEDWTLWLQDVLHEEADRVQPMWLSAHVAHAREELQHTVTDRVFLDCIRADAVQQRAWARDALVDIALPNVLLGRMVRAICGELHPEIPLSPPSDESVLLRLLGERGFRRLCKQVPLYAELARGDEAIVQPATPAALPARHDLVEVVRAHVAALLDRPAADIDAGASFARLGLDSAMRITLSGALEQALGVSIPTTIAYEHPSVDAVADAIGARSAPARRAAATGPDDLASTRQARLFHLHQAHGGAAFRDHLVVGGALRDAVDEEALAVALSELVQRHPGLRTTFTQADDDTVRTVVHDTAPITLRQVEADDARTAARRLAARLDARPYDLGRGPLLRAAVVRDDRSAFVVLAAHHIIADSWSLDVLLRDWLALARARRDATPVDLPTLSRTPRELARDEARLPDPERLAWWTRRLADHACVTGAPPAVSFTGGSVAVHLDAERFARLRAWASAHDESPFAVLLGAVLLVLHRTEQLTDALVGTHRHRRDQAELHGVVDYRVDVLLLRTDLSGLSDLADAVDRGRRTWVDALAHAVGVDALVPHLAPHHARARSLLAPLAVNWIPFGFRADDPAFTYDGSLVPRPGLLFFERMLLAQPRDDGLSLVLWHNTETVPQDAARGFLDRVVAALPG